MNRVKVVRLLIPALVVGTLIATTFSPDVRPTLVGAFGERPFGLPVASVVAVAEFVVFLPLLWSLYHFAKIAEQAAKEGVGLGKIRLLIYAATVGQRQPALRPSQLASLFGLIYFAVICAAWIVYASSKGI